MGVGASAGGFRHEALMYAGDDELVAAAVPFVLAAVTRGESVLVMLAPQRLALVEQALGPDAAAVELADMSTVGANPGRIIPAWQRFLGRDSDVSRPVSGVGEPIWATRTADELVEAQRHESLLNLAFAEARSFRLLCPYDVVALPPAVVREARRSHPAVMSGGTLATSDQFRADLSPAPHAGALPEPPTVLATVDFDRLTLDVVRAHVAEAARGAGVPGERVADLVLAIHELATNSLRHGGGSGRLRLWTEPGAVVCEVADAGTIADPMAGRYEPAPQQLGGRGLWLAHHLCDLVQVRSAQGATVVRVRMGTREAATRPGAAVTSR